MTEAAEQELIRSVQSLIQNNLRYEVLIRAVVNVLEKKKQTDGTPLITIEELNTTAEDIKKQIIASAQAQAEAAAKAATPVTPAPAVVPPNA
jgi:uncharacterized protein YkwD